MSTGMWLWNRYPAARQAVTMEQMWRFDRDHGQIGATAMLLQVNGASNPVQIEADFGPLRLTAAGVSAQVKPTTTARVDLYWSVQAAGGEPLVDSVHVVDAGGRKVAQHDGPVATEYTPPIRWMSGQELVDSHPISLPAYLRPGDYRLLAGLYPVGNGEIPLVPTGHLTPRVDAGWLRVRSARDWPALQKGGSAP